MCSTNNIPQYEKINSRVTRVGTFEVRVPTHVALRMFIMQVLASQLHFLANKNAELAIPPLFWPVNCIKTGGHVALLSDPTVYSLYCVIYFLSDSLFILFPFVKYICMHVLVYVSTLSQ